MKIVLYAGDPAGARSLLSWIGALARIGPVDASFVSLAGQDGDREAAAAGIQAAVSGMQGVAFRRLRESADRPEEAIIQAAGLSEADLVLVAPDDRRGFARFLRGSMAEHLAQELSASLLVAREGWTPGRRIITCVSGSPRSLTHAHLAAVLARALGATVELVMVLSQLEIAMQDSAAESALVDQLRRCHEIVEREGISVEVRELRGLVVDEILDRMQGRDAGLMLLGAHRAEAYDPMFEDLTAELLAGTEKPVFVVGRADPPLGACPSIR